MFVTLAGLLYSNFFCIIYEVKYCSTPLSLKEMREEEEQIKMIKGIKVGKVGFIAANGFEELVPEYDYITGEELYL